MTFVMGIVTMIRVTRNMPKKTIYSTPEYCEERVETSKVQQTSAPAISSADYVTVMKRMAELEDKVNVLLTKPATMPPEKEEMLNAALSRVDALEQELMATKKVIIGFRVSVNFIGKLY